MNHRTNNQRLDRARRLGEKHSALRRPPSAFAKPSAFTLVELLVVIVIIAILAALLIPAVTNARISAIHAAIKAEIGNIDGAIESYKNDVAGSYPPDAMIGNLSPTSPVAEKIFSDFKRHFKKAFPRSREDENLLRALVGMPPANATNRLQVDTTNLAGGMSPAETLVFFLQRFSSNPQYPISGPGGPSFIVDTSLPAGGEDLAARQWIVAFNENRYGPRDDSNFFDGRFIVCNESNRDYNGNGVTGETFQINFWVYTPGSSTQPLVYFDASRGFHDIDHPLLEDAGVEIHPLKQLKAGAQARSPQLLGDLQLANEGKFQILHCGNDGAWGDFGVMHIDPGEFFANNWQNNEAPASLLLYPGGPFSLELADTVTNFADQSTLEAAQQ